MSACQKNHVSLWEKSCQFVVKIMSICGKNHVGLWEKSCQFCGKNQVGLWEKFVGLKKSLENTRRYTGKKYRIIYVYLPTASHNVYLTENSSKLKTVYLPLPKRSPTLVPISFVGRKQFFPPTHLFNLGIHTGD